MPGFVILEHDHPTRHWDFMLEVGDILRTWRLAAPPQPGLPIAAELTFDHRKFYMNYEGPVRGNRGHVLRWDWGTYTTEVPETEIGVRPTIVHLQGQRLQGVAVLDPITAQQWTFTLRCGQRPIVSGGELV
jgi:bifunctional non-homologous end joining protein LigD